MSIRSLSSILRVLGAALFFFGSTTLVAAHSEPVSSSPGENTTVAAPTSVSITFSEELDPSGTTIMVVGADGTTVSQGAGAISPTDVKTMSVALQANLAPGVYTVKWASKSAADGDSANGSYNFTVGAATATSAPVAAALPNTGATDLPISLMALAGIVLLGSGIPLRRFQARRN